MIEFKSTEDLSKLSPDDPAFPIVEDLVKRLITDYIAEGSLANRPFSTVYSKRSFSSLQQSHKELYSPLGN